MKRMSFRVAALGVIGMGAMLSIMMTMPVISLYLDARAGFPPSTSEPSSASCRRPSSSPRSSRRRYLNRSAFGAIRGLLWPVVFAEVADSSPPGRRGYFDSYPRRHRSRPAWA